MTDEPDDIVLHHLIEMRKDMALMRADMATMQTDVTTLSNGQTVLAQMVLRIERDMVQVKPLLGQIGTRIALLIREGIPVKARGPK